MRTFATAVLLAPILMSVPGAARSTEDGAGAVVVPLVDEQDVAPSEPVPQRPPPAPPAQPPAPPVQQQYAAAQSASDGQWVYTQQYGWIWIPYGDAYSYVPPSGQGEPYEYVYYPSYGWTWVVAPWIWGFGPWPYFGVYGAVYFGWYGHGWWRTPWRWRFRPTPYYHGIRPAPVHAGLGMHATPTGRGHIRVGGGGHGHR
jgi:hypothetical protein